MNSTEVLLEQELQLFVDADSVELLGRLKSRLHTLPRHPWNPSKRHKIPDMKGILSSSSQIGSSMLVLLSCKICLFGKQKITLGSMREKGERQNKALLTS